jgi:type II secretory pathway pseudopilin PulG
MYMLKSSRGFAMVEILVVVGILALLFGVVMYATNAQSKSTSNTQRRVDVNAILHAVELYANQNSGRLPEGVTTTPKLIASTPGATAINLCQILAPTFIETIPLDPTAGLAVPVGAKCHEKNVRYNSGYTVMATGQHVTVAAPAAEGGEQIFASN